MPNGRCRMHGGTAGRPITHGRYSKISRPRIADLLVELDSDPDPLDLLPEVKLLRALIQDYVERYDEMTEALLAWHESWQGKNASPKPRQIVDILSVGKFIGEIGRLADRHHKRQHEGSISLQTLDRILEQLGLEVVSALQEIVSDDTMRPQILASIERRWGSVRLEPGPGRRSGPSADEDESPLALPQ